MLEVVVAEEGEGGSLFSIGLLDTFERFLSTVGMTIIVNSFCSTMF